MKNTGIHILLFENASDKYQQLASVPADAKFVVLVDPPMEEFFPGAIQMILYGGYVPPDKYILGDTTVYIVYE